LAITFKDLVFALLNTSNGPECAKYLAISPQTFNRTIKKQWSESWKGYKSDSAINGFGDTLVFMLGMLLSKKYNNIYLFIFIFLVGFIFFSKKFQDFLVNHRLQYLKSKDNTLNVDNRKFYTYSYYLDYTWIIVSLFTFIKLYIIHKKIKSIKIK
jgi:hypothetical protein